jgi:hypothetical protein
MVWLDLLGGLAGAGKAAVGSSGLESAALSTVVQGSPGRSGRHGEFVLLGGIREVELTRQERSCQGTFRPPRSLADPPGSQSQPENCEPQGNEDKAAIIID